MQNNKSSTIDLHNINQDIYLSFLDEELFLPTPALFQTSFFGGCPILIHQLKQQQQTCSLCQARLSFLGQVYCPFNAQHCYHRILYFLVCEGCLKQFKCIRQQAPEDYTPTAIKSKLKKICQAKQLESENYSRNQFIKMLNKLKAQIQEDQAIEEAESQQQDEQEVKKQVQAQPLQQQFTKYQKIVSNSKEKNQNFGENQQPLNKEQQKDLVFQVYRRGIVELNNPCLIYTDIPLPYNKRTLNPQHFCKQCGAKLSLQVQITERVLTMSNDPNSKLLMMDWGSLMVYTCGSSCNKGGEQCLVVQYEIDAINEQDLKKLKKSKKNKKKKQKKQKSKQKQIKQKDESDSQQQGKKEQTPQIKQEGDWD